MHIEIPIFSTTQILEVVTFYFLFRINITILLTHLREKFNVGCGDCVWGDPITAVPSFSGYDSEQSLIIY